MTELLRLKRLWDPETLYFGETNAGCFEQPLKQSTEDKIATKSADADAAASLDRVDPPAPDRLQCSESL